jgi:hypothetical protein
MMLWMAAMETIELVNSSNGFQIKILKNHPGGTGQNQKNAGRTDVILIPRTS